MVHHESFDWQLRALLVESPPRRLEAPCGLTPSSSHTRPGCGGRFPANGKPRQDHAVCTFVAICFERIFLVSLLISFIPFHLNCRTFSRPSAGSNSLHVSRPAEPWSAFHHFRAVKLVISWNLNVTKRCLNASLHLM